MVDALVSALKQGTLHVDCVEMTLVQNTATRPITFKGAGFIRQNDEGQLNFKLYVAEVANTSSLEHIRAFSEGKPGALFAESEFYTLTARTQEGLLWTAGRILPKLSWGAAAQNYPIAIGALERIETKYTTRNLDPEHFLQLHFFSDADIPCTQFSKTETDGLSIINRDHATFSAMGCDFRVHKRDDEFTIAASSASAMDQTFPTRILEALQYLLARSLLWGVLIKRDKGEQLVELVSSRTHSAKTRLDPPLSQGPGFYDFSWPLFSSYLQYIVKTASHPYWHHCSYHLHNACEASANSYDAWAIGVSVAVEGLCDLLPVEQEAKWKERVKQIQRTIVHDVLSRDNYADLAERVRGLIGMLGNVRVQEHLDPLVAQGYAHGDYVKAWLRLRNKHVHPKEIDVQKLTMGDYQELIDLIFKSTVLMYEITFYLIGYRGKFTDYSTHGFPAKDYPLPAPLTGQMG